MAKQNPLTQALNQQNRQTEQKPDFSVVAAAQSTKPQSRIGRVLIGGHFPPEVQIALKIIAAEERSSVQSLIAEGINAVLARRHKPQIATLSPQNQNSSES